MNDDDVVQVYLAAQPHQAHFLCNVLADAGIEARALGENMNRVDPPANLRSGAVWVRGRDAEWARQILIEWEQAQAPHPSADETTATWICPTCGEAVDEGFELCWNCETVRAPT